MKANLKRTLLCLTAASLFSVLAGIHRAEAIIAFEWTEGGPGNGVNSPHVSFHNTTGPVLADDFTSAASGSVSLVEWWGSAPIVAGAPDTWEITFHTDAGGVPALTLPSGGISQHFVSATGTDGDGDGVFYFSAAWNPQDVVLTAGTDYWFSVANGSGNTWTWANPGPVAPTVGTEQYTAVVSVGGAPSVIAGPHDGPWTAVTQVAKQDFAFRISVASIPEPGTLGLLGLGLAALGFMRRRA